MFSISKITFSNLTINSAMKRTFPAIFCLFIILVNISCDNPLENISPALPDGPINFTNQLDKKLLAVGQFEGPSTCTATYIEVPNQTLDSPAYVITNGHCTNIINEDNPIYLDVPLDAKVVFKKLEGITDDKQVSFSTKKIAYGTMKGTDLAIVQLNHSNKELQNAGIFPIKIANNLPIFGGKIQACGYPLSLQPVQLRMSNGIQGNRSSISEFIWLWHDFYANNFKNIFGGSSGSPVFEDLNKGIWGMINTTTIGGLGTCELGAPCEFLSNISPITKNETTYVLDIRKIKGSFNAKGIFDINLSTNELEKPFDLKVSLDLGVRNFGKEQVMNEKLTFEVENFIQTSYRIDPFEAFDKNNNTGFSPVVAGTMQIPFPQKEGFYVLSFLKKNQKSYLTFKIDFTPPNADLIKLNQTKDAEGFYIEPIFKYPEIVNYQWKTGPLATCNCADQSDLEPYFRFAKFVPLNELPAKVCVYGYDLAGNQSKLREFVLTK